MSLAVFDPLERAFAGRFGGSEEEGIFLAYLLKAAREGHLCVEVGEEIRPLLGLEEIREKIKAGAHERREVVRAGRSYYLRRFFVEEERVKEGLEKLQGEPHLAWIPKDLSPLLPEQVDAVLAPGKHRLSIVTGGPGTGKSFVAKHLVRACKGRVSIAAPTGKAAANIGGETLHSLLKTEWLAADLVVVDEASMIDVHLMAKLLNAIKPGARLVLMGDADQLPPVEAGSLFADLVRRGENVTHLSQCLRIESKEIHALMEHVRKGEIDEAMRAIGGFRIEEDPVRWAHRHEAPILSPVRQGPLGVDVLNTRLGSLKKGDAAPIMICKNNHELNLFNGEIGLIKGGKAHFGERVFPIAALPAYEPAYCLSVHKSQGSEFDRVLLVVPPTSERFGRELFYTAITRAKKELAIVGDDEVIRAMLNKRACRLSNV